ncbi:unnamed protein product, partial [Symbiodinium necroappetens]
MGRVWAAWFQHAELFKADAPFHSKVKMIRTLIQGTWQWVAGAVHWNADDLVAFNTLQVRIYRLAFGLHVGFMHNTLSDGPPRCFDYNTNWLDTGDVNERDRNLVWLRPCFAGGTWNGGDMNKSGQCHLVVVIRGVFTLITLRGGLVSSLATNGCCALRTETDGVKGYSCGSNSLTYGFAHFERLDGRAAGARYCVLTQPEQQTAVANTFLVVSMELLVEHTGWSMGIAGTIAIVDMELFVDDGEMLQSMEMPAPILRGLGMIGRAPISQMRINGD